MISQTDFRTLIENYWGIFLRPLVGNEQLKLAFCFQFQSEKTVETALKKLEWKQVLFSAVRSGGRVLRLLANRYLDFYFYSNGTRLYLVNTPVHAIAMNKWGFSDDLKKFDINVNGFSRLLAVFAAVKETIYFVPVLKNLEKDGHLDLKSFLFLLFNFFSEVLVACLWIKRLNEACRISPYEEIYCFESGTVAYAVNRYAVHNKKVSHYVQHGLHDIVMPMLETQVYHLWYRWDAQLLHSFAIRPLELYFLQKTITPFRHLTSGKKTAVIALEYQTANFNHSGMISWWTEIIRVLESHGWNVLLRPHPRDMTEWYKEIKGAHVVSESISMSQFLQKYDVSLLFTIASASALEAIDFGIATFSKLDKGNMHVLCPFSDISFTLKETAELDRFLSLDVAIQNDLIEKKAFLCEKLLKEDLNAK